MATIDAGTLTARQLAPMLRAWADGDFAAEAAVELLINHHTWLTRADFVAALIDAVDEGWAALGRTTPMAAVDWKAVPAYLTKAGGWASSSEVSILLIAAGLGGAVPLTSLQAMTAGLDDANSALVLDALAHRFGWHQRGKIRLVAGTFTDEPTGPCSLPEQATLRAVRHA